MQSNVTIAKSPDKDPVSETSVLEVEVAANSGESMPVTRLVQPSIPLGDLPCEILEQVFGFLLFSTCERRDLSGLAMTSKAMGSMIARYLRNAYRDPLYWNALDELTVRDCRRPELVTLRRGANPELLAQQISQRDAARKKIQLIAYSDAPWSASVGKALGALHEKEFDLCIFPPMNSKTVDVQGCSLDNWNPAKILRFIPLGKKVKIHFKMDFLNQPEIYGRQLKELFQTMRDHPVAYELRLLALPAKNPEEQEKALPPEVFSSLINGVGAARLIEFEFVLTKRQLSALVSALKACPAGILQQVVLKSQGNKLTEAELSEICEDINAVRRERKVPELSVTASMRSYETDSDDSDSDASDSDSSDSDSSDSDDDPSYKAMIVEYMTRLKYQVSTSSDDTASSESGDSSESSDNEDSE